MPDSAPSAVRKKVQFNVLAPAFVTPHTEVSRNVVYWCSGISNDSEGFSAHWRGLGGHDCVLLDRIRDFKCDLMRDGLVDSQVSYLEEHRGHHPVDAVFSPPCGVSSVSRFKLLEEYPVLVTCVHTGEHAVFVPGLSLSDVARVRGWHELIRRCCAHAMRVFDAGGNSSSKVHLSATPPLACSRASARESLMVL